MDWKESKNNLGGKMNETEELKKKIQELEKALEKERKEKEKIQVKRLGIKVMPEKFLKGLIMLFL